MRVYYTSCFNIFFVSGQLSINDIINFSIAGMLSHQLKQGKIDGEKTIIQNPTDAQKREHEKHDFETHEVYAMDVLISTGDAVVSSL